MINDSRSEPEAGEPSTKSFIFGKVTLSRTDHNHIESENGILPLLIMIIKLVCVWKPEYNIAYLPSHDIMVELVTRLPVMVCWPSKCKDYQWAGDAE